jgi:hypothetical protein
MWKGFPVWKLVNVLHFVFVLSIEREEFVGYSFNAQSFGGIMPLFLPCRSLWYFPLSFISVECFVQLILVHTILLYQGSNGTGVLKPV